MWNKSKFVSTQKEVFTYLKMNMKQPRKSSHFYKNLQEYADVATTHGVRYAVKEDSHWFERFLWTLIVLFATFCAMYASISIYIAWQENPVLTTIGTLSKDITELDFPSVTLCSQGNNIKELSHLPHLLPEEWGQFWGSADGSTEFDSLEDVEKSNLLIAFMVDQVSALWH